MANLPGALIGAIKKKQAMKGAMMPKAKAMNVNQPMPAASPAPTSVNSKPIRSLDQLRAKAKSIPQESGMFNGNYLGV